MKIFCCKNLCHILYAVLQLVNFFSGDLLSLSLSPQTGDWIRNWPYLPFMHRPFICFVPTRKKKKKRAHKAAQTFENWFRKKKTTAAMRNWGSKKGQKEKADQRSIYLLFRHKTFDAYNFRFFSLLYFLSGSLARSLLLFPRIEIIISTTFAQHHKSCWQSPPGLKPNGGNSAYSTYYTHNISQKWLLYLWSFCLALPIVV